MEWELKSYRSANREVNLDDDMGLVYIDLHITKAKKLLAILQQLGNLKEALQIIKNSGICRWVSVKDRLPDGNTYVDVLTSSGQRLISCKLSYDTMSIFNEPVWMTTSACMIRVSSTTHWIEITTP
jgi:Protein of unknown function (DUF551)